MSPTCSVSVVILHTWHSLWMACIGDKLACSCIHASYKVAGTGDVVV